MEMEGCDCEFIIIKQKEMHFVEDEVSFSFVEEEVSVKTESIQN